MSDAIEKGIHLREHIMELNNDDYHGELMKFVVIGGGCDMAPVRINK